MTATRIIPIFVSYYYLVSVGLRIIATAFIVHLLLYSYTWPCTRTVHCFIYYMFNVVWQYANCLPPPPPLFPTSTTCRRRWYADGPATTTCTALRPLRSTSRHCHRCSYNCHSITITLFSLVLHSVSTDGVLYLLLILIQTICFDIHPTQYLFNAELFSTYFPSSWLH